MLCLLLLALPRLHPKSEQVQPLNLRAAGAGVSDHRIQWFHGCWDLLTQRAAAVGDRRYSNPALDLRYAAGGLILAGLLMASLSCGGGSSSGGGGTPPSTVESGAVTVTGTSSSTSHSTTISVSVN
jgi:hypothetical protein